MICQSCYKTWYAKLILGKTLEKCLASAIYFNSQLDKRSQNADKGQQKFYENI